MILKFIGVCEHIGESVASVLGLDESMFQEILDNMSPEELRQAEEVDRERREEDSTHSASDIQNLEPSNRV